MSSDRTPLGKRAVIFQEFMKIATAGELDHRTEHQEVGKV